MPRTPKPIETTRRLRRCGFAALLLTPLLLLLQNAGTTDTPNVKDLNHPLVRESEEWNRLRICGDWLEDGKPEAVLMMAGFLRANGDVAGANALLRTGAVKWRIPAAAMLLAVVHDRGVGVPRNPPLAGFWAERAAYLAEQAGDAEIAARARALLNEARRHEAPR